MSGLISQKDIIGVVYLKFLLPLCDTIDNFNRFSTALRKIGNHKINKLEAINNELCNFFKTYLTTDKLIPILNKKVE